MGQKMNPNGLRVGIIKDWSSKWYADSKHFGDYLVEDHKIREYVKKKLYVSGISKVEIERTAKFVKVNVYTAKPGLVIGKGGNLTIAKASSASFPLIKSATILTFLLEILAYFNVALACSTSFCTSSCFASTIFTSLFYFFVVVFSPACPLNVLVGANSPNLCPIISSVIYTGTCFLPS